MSEYLEALNVLAAAAGWIVLTSWLLVRPAVRAWRARRRRAGRVAVRLEADTRRFNEAMGRLARRAATSPLGGYASSDRPASDLGPPPSGPAPGAGKPLRRDLTRW